MNRFEQKRIRFRGIRALLPVLIFGFAIVLFLLGLDSVTRTAQTEEAKNLRDSILHSAVQCYALEGFYPEDLSYLEEHYHVSYDHEKYMISYEAVGSNLMPDVRVIPLSESEKEEAS